MRKLFTTALGILLSLGAFAQMMPDSTFQVVAYWAKGDKISYDCSSRVVQIQPDSTEVEQLSLSEVRTFEVIDQTDTSYTLRLKHSDISTTQMAPGLESDVFNAIWQGMNFDIMTDQLGSLQRYVNLDEMMSSAAQSVPAILDEVSSRYKKKELKDAGYDKDQWVTRFSAMFNNRDMLYTATNKDVVPLFYYHGARLDPKQDYVIEKDYPNVVGAQGLKADMHFWVDEAQSDSVFVVLFSRAEADGESLLPAMRDATLAMLQNSMSPEEFEEAAPSVILQFDKSNMSIAFLEETGIIIDLGSGWPVQFYSETRVTIKAADGTVSVVTTNEVNYKDPEES